MKTPLPLLAALMLGACVSAGGSAQSVAGVELQVTLDDGYYWPSGAQVGPDIISTFPIVTALVVTRRDGAPLGVGDEALARSAANAHCAALGEGPPGPDSRHAEGAFAFYPCTAA